VIPGREFAGSAPVPATAPGDPAAAGGLRGALPLAKPGIVAASALAGYAGMTVAARGIPPAGSAFAALAAIVLAAAGAALLNGVLDAGIDRGMERLAGRSASLARIGEGRVLAAALALVAASLAIASARLNLLAAALILAAVLSYALLYTLFLKRRSPWGAVPGGIPGALPVLIGYASVAGTLRPDALPLFVLMLLWQPPHFWLLALAWREDYRAAGIPVLPVAMGEGYAKLLVLLYASSLVPVAMVPWMLGAASPALAAFAALAGLAFAGACHLLAVRSDRYRLAFRASILYLAAVLLAVVADAASR
jgi:protoheme IX farnesyltransferase